MGIESQVETARRLIRRDRQLRQSGASAPWGAVSRIVDYVMQKRLLHDEVVFGWLEEVSATADMWLGHRLCKCVSEYLERGERERALQLFRVISGLEHTERWQAIGAVISQNLGMLGAEVDGILRRSMLIVESPDGWGAAVVELLRRVIVERQRARRQSLSVSRVGGSGVAHDPQSEECEDEVELDDYPDVWYFSRVYSGDTACLLADAVATALQEAIKRDEEKTFKCLADCLLRTRLAVGGALVLAALLDELSIKSSAAKQWLVSESCRVLCQKSVQEHYSLVDLRRLMRGVLTPPSHDDVLAITSVVRESTLPESVVMRELSDIAAWGGLTSEEQGVVEDAQIRGEVSPPVDPRVEPRIRVGGIREWAPHQSQVGWPYTEDHEAIGVLVERSRTVFEVAMCAEEGAMSLRRRLDALERISEREECDKAEWFGEVLAWCVSAVSDLRQCARIQAGQDMESGMLSSEQWECTLNLRASWWQARARAAVRRLGESVPKSHVDRSAASMSWGSNDTMFQSLTFLDEVLAVEGDGPFVELRQQLDEAVSQSWESWPPFTRATALCTLRTWYWHRLPGLRVVLLGLGRTIAEPGVIQHGVAHLLKMDGPERVESLEFCLRNAGRTDDTGRTVWWIGHVIGQYVVRACGQEQGQDELAEVYDRVRERPIECHASRQSFLTGLLDGAGRWAASSESLSRDHVDEWLKVLVLIEATWVWMDSESPESQRFPLFALFAGLNAKWPDSEQSRIADGCMPMLLRVLREGTIGDFCALHWELTEGERTTSARPWSLLGEMSAAHLITLCRASVERVLAWRINGQSTSDMGWATALYGHETSELIKAAVSAASDRDYLRRELPVIIDRLLSAKCYEKAAEVRLYLRGVR